MKLPLIALLFLASFPAHAETIVSMSVGNVKLLSQGSSEWRDVKSRSAVKNGDTIQTGPGSFAEISADGGTIRIQPKTTVKLGQNLTEGKPQGFLSLFLGSINCRMKKLKKSGGGYSVSTASSVCAIRGTEFDVASSADGTTILQVTEGAVAFDGLSGSVLVAANQESSAGIGKNPEPVKVIRKQDWKIWADQASTSVKGKESEVIEGCLAKIRKLDADIAQLEDEKKKADAESAGLFAESKKVRAGGDTKEADRIAGEAERKHTAASSKLSMAYYQASRMELVMNVADNAYSSAEDKSVIKKSHDEMKSIYLRHFRTYIKPVLDEAAKRQIIRDRKKSKTKEHTI